jgi:hypothetical protein
MSVKLAAVTLARSIGFIEVVDLNPHGRVFYPDIVRELVKRYNFQKFPQSVEELNEQKGVEFVEGRWQETVIEKFVIYNTGLMVETRASTDISRRIIEDALQTGRELGLTYEDGMISRWAYVNDFTFYSDIPLLAVFSDSLSRIAERVGAEVSRIFGEPFSFETTGFLIGHDQLVRKYGVVPFTIQRRSDVPFRENKYFSEAPLPTGVHFALVEQFEQEVLSGMGAAARAK